ncbi:type II toxin-antitoxin system RelE/ParE family toxin [Polyangium sp. y55x31]|uniref:type II toxin-antitoxin system RelE/ParE family toxin n=1 Tax=Polyangium sp. y55x31 TaxID=3042688 RepID=UPI002482BC4D|nr:type II toxin-antitoxin system RelE/ParE family toxin [Polyangium sp. y55x31]MDI1477445.1 type II toxin-antitoxin system RelE/ParE family toxin [Polyangium sp. y55x31]
MMDVRFARRALGELERIEMWCQANATGLWPKFVAELAQAVRLLRVVPEVGAEYQAGPVGVRRLLLEKTQFYVYYRYHPTKALVVILAIWSTRRRRPPSLR